MRRTSIPCQFTENKEVIDKSTFKVTSVYIRLVQTKIRSVVLESPGKKENTDEQQPSRCSAYKSEYGKLDF